MQVFDQALIFKRVVELGSMAAVARELSLSPSVVSKRIAQLEQQLAVQLLRRTTRRISLTEAGELFYKQLGQVSGQWQSLLDETASLGQQAKGRLLIAAPQPVLSRVLLPLVAQFQLAYPLVEVALQNVLYHQMPLAAADITIGRRLENLDSGAMVGTRLCNYQNALFAAPNYLKDKGMPTKMADLTSHACLSYGIGQHSAQWHFEKGSVTVSGPICSDNTEVIINAAVLAQGIAYVPKMIIKQELEREQLVAVLENLKSNDFEMWGYYQKMDYVPLKLRVFIDFIKQYFMQPTEFKK